MNAPLTRTITIVDQVNLVNDYYFTSDEQKLLLDLIDTEVEMLLECILEDNELHQLRYDQLFFEKIREFKEDYLHDRQEDLLNGDEDAQEEIDDNQADIAVLNKLLDYMKQFGIDEIV